MEYHFADAVVLPTGLFVIPAIRRMGLRDKRRKGGKAERQKGRAVEKTEKGRRPLDGVFSASHLKSGIWHLASFLQIFPKTHYIFL